MAREDGRAGGRVAVQRPTDVMTAAAGQHVSISDTTLVIEDIVTFCRTICDTSKVSCDECPLDKYDR